MRAKVDTLNPTRCLEIELGGEDVQVFFTHYPGDASFPDHNEIEDVIVRNVSILTIIEDLGSLDIIELKISNALVAQGVRDLEDTQEDSREDLYFDNGQ